MNNTVAEYFTTWTEEREELARHKGEMLRLLNLYEKCPEEAKDPIKRRLTLRHYMEAERDLNQ